MPAVRRGYQARSEAERPLDHTLDWLLLAAASGLLIALVAR